MGPLINYREERANARDEREVLISGRHYRRQDDADGIITRPRHHWLRATRRNFASPPGGRPHWRGGPPTPWLETIRVCVCVLFEALGSPEALGSHEAPLGSPGYRYGLPGVP